MPLSLSQTQAVAALAAHLYDYLPGSSPWRTYTFASAAQECGVGQFWIPGSKLPALTFLLESTLAKHSSAFCPLVETIVREGLKHRTKAGTPMSKADLAQLNGLVEALGFRIPALWDPTFAASLPEPPRSVEPEVSRTAPSADEHSARRQEALDELCARFLELHKWADRQAAGRALERLLRDLFLAFDLSPRGAFVVLGEQIDGSIVLDGSSYLVEAKWEAGPIGLAPLLIFREKVAAKSSVTRGIFVSVNGYDEGARAGITAGKQPNFLMLDGAHIFAVMCGNRDLVTLLRALLRELADTGRPFVPLPDVPRDGP